MSLQIPSNLLLMFALLVAFSACKKEEGARLMSPSLLLI